MFNRETLHGICGLTAKVITVGGGLSVMIYHATILEAFGFWVIPLAGAVGFSLAILVNLFGE